MLFPVSPKEYGISSADFHAEFGEKMHFAVLAFTSHRVARSMLHAPPPGLQVSLRQGTEMLFCLSVVNYKHVEKGALEDLINMPRRICTLLFCSFSIADVKIWLLRTYNSHKFAVVLQSLCRPVRCRVYFLSRIPTNRGTFRTSDRRTNNI